MKLEELRVGDKVQWWTFTGEHKGCDTSDLMAGVVIKLAKVKAKVRTEYGDEGWMYPHHLSPRNWEPGE